MVAGGDQQQAAAALAAAMCSISSASSQQPALLDGPEMAALRGCCSGLRPCALPAALHGPYTLACASAAFQSGFVAVGRYLVALLQEQLQVRCSPSLLHAGMHGVPG
jgi:hypothetical protein